MVRDQYMTSVYKTRKGSQPRFSSSPLPRSTWRWVDLNLGEGLAWDVYFADLHRRGHTLVSTYTPITIYKVRGNQTKSGKEGKEEEVTHLSDSWKNKNTHASWMWMHAVECALTCISWHACECMMQHRHNAHSYTLQHRHNAHSYTLQRTFIHTHSIHVFTSSDVPS